MIDQIRGEIKKHLEVIKEICPVYMGMENYKKKLTKEGFFPPNDCGLEISEELLSDTPSVWKSERIRTEEKHTMFYHLFSISELIEKVKKEYEDYISPSLYEMLKSPPYNSGKCVNCTEVKKWLDYVEKWLVFSETYSKFKKARGRE